MRGKTLTAFIRSPKILGVFLAALLVLGGLTISVRATANDLPLAAGSPLTGLSFDDRPLLLPVQRNFQMAMLTASSQIGRSCGRMEAYGWRVGQTEQHRVNLVFSNTVDRLRGLGYTVEAQTPSSISKDITMYTADRPDKHFLFMWSAGEIGLVMVLCESTAPPTGRMAEMYNPSSAPKGVAPPQAVLQSKLGPAPVPVPGAPMHKYNPEGFTPVGDWVGDYTCMRGYTGATMHIDKFKGEDFRGTIRFYPTAKNPYIPKGSYAIYGQYDKESKRILINPGAWIVHPSGYYKTILIGSFDPGERSFSGFFQGIMGCTSFEAKSDVKSAEVPGKKIVRKKAKPKAKKKSSKPVPAVAQPAAAEPTIVNPSTPDEAIAQPPQAVPSPATATPSAPAPVPANSAAKPTTPAPQAAPVAPVPAPAPASAAPMPLTPDATAPAPVAPTGPVITPPTLPIPDATTPKTDAKPTSALERKYGQHLIVLAGDWPATPSAPQLAPAPTYDVTVPQLNPAPTYNTEVPQVTSATQYNTTAQQYPVAEPYQVTAPQLPEAEQYNVTVPQLNPASTYNTEVPQVTPATQYNTDAPKLPEAESYSIYTAPGS